MSKNRFHFVLAILALLASAAHGGPPSDTSTCNAQAWARAPDLTPNDIVHGDARVKISAECPDIDDVLLGLRFKERSFAKVLRSREDVKRLHPEPPARGGLSYMSEMSPWAMPSHFANRSVQDAYEEVLTNKDLWIVREEERLVFETTAPINMLNKSYGILRDDVQNFAILVPSTNFPPAFNNLDTMVMMYAGNQEIVEAEWMYEYFVKISFADSTTREISAGLTAFQPSHDPTYISDGLGSATVELQSFFGIEKYPSNYSINLSAVSGLTFSAGTRSRPVTAVITRTGPPRSPFSVPLNISICVMPEIKFEWDAEYDVLDTNTNEALCGRIPPPKLRAASHSRKRSRGMWEVLHSCQASQKIPVVMPDFTSNGSQTNTIVTTTSAPVTLFVDVDEDNIPTFEGYYQTLANSLSITLETPCTEDVSGEPEFLSWAPSFEDDEEAWVPWEKKADVRPRNSWKSYNGRVPVVVHPFVEGAPSLDCPNARAGAPEQVVLTNGEGCKQRSLTHYLAEHARGPIFVDIDAVPHILSEDPAERQLRAPILVPVVSSPPEGDEAVQRYYRRLDPKKPLIYVGETWAKKVAHLKDESSSSQY